MRWIIPVLIAGQAAGGLLLASGLWTISSNFIYAAVSITYSVGGLTAFATIPWLMISGYKPALVSNLYLGGSIASQVASVLAMVQGPGSATPLFSPQVFFAILTVPVVIICPVAYRAITKSGIGLVDPPAGLGARESDRVSMDDDEEIAKESSRSLERESLQEQEQLIGLPASKTLSAVADAADEKGGCGSMESFRAWGPRALPLVLLFSCIQVSSQAICRCCDV